MKPVYTLFMVILVAAMAAYIFAFERGPTPEKPNQGQATEHILTLDLEQLESLELSQNAPAASLKLSKSEGKWLFDGQPANQQRIENMLRQLAPWQASRVLEEHFDLKQAQEFGLEPPDLILTLKHGSTSSVLQVGSQSPGNTGYYVTKTGDPRLYLSFVNVPEDLRRLLTDPPLPVPEPVASASK